MRIVPIDIIKSMSGKLCKHSNTSISLNSSSGIMHSSTLCNPFKGQASAKQVAQREAFKKKAGLIASWLRDNCPSVANGEKGTEAYRKALSLKKQLMLSNIGQVIHKYIDDKGVVTLPVGNITVPEGTPGGNTTPNPGGEAAV